MEVLEGIILRHTDYGEHDRIFGLFTKQHGRISAFAAGARKSQRRYGSSLDLFSHVQVQMTKPNQGKSLWRLNGVISNDPGQGIRTNLFALAYMSYFCECVSTFLAEEDPHENVFGFLLDCQKYFSSYQDDYSRLIQLELELLHHCGYGPRFLDCAECGRQITDPKALFSFSKGGTVCSSCSSQNQGLWVAMQPVYDLLAPSNPSIAKEQAATYSPSFGKREEFLSVRGVLDQFVVHLVGRPLKSQNFRKEIYHAKI